MRSASFLLVLLLGFAGPAIAQEDEAFATPATRALVERVIRESAQLPEGLHDYVAKVRTEMSIALAPDSTLASDVEPAVDQFASQVRWTRAGYLHQRVVGHRVRLKVPAPYTLGTLMDQPWVIPHLYGPTIPVFAAPKGRRSVGAVNPFGELGPRHYRYALGDTVRLRLRDDVLTLVPVIVTPRTPTGDRQQLLVAGTFYVDADRAAVARARLGVLEGTGALQPLRTGLYWELENGFWQGRYWLPYRQRREVQITSPFLGGAVAGRIVSTFTDFDLNTGWIPYGADPLLLTRDYLPGDTVFGDWEEPGADLAEYAAEDFADLRLAAMGTGVPEHPQLHLYYQRGEHFFRYNRVEGLFLGLGGRLLPADPRTRKWQLYGTGGWAFAEETPRGQLTAWYSNSRLGPLPEEGRWVAHASLYRDLRPLTSFLPTFNWDFAYSLPALFAGTDERDYYDAAGASLFGAREEGPWVARAGVRWEEHEPVEIHTTRYLFGDAEEFPALADIEPGTHVGVEGTLAYTRGPGAIGIGNSLVASLHGEAGVGDFGFQRATALLSLRRTWEPITIAGRVDAGHAWGEIPPQKLFLLDRLEALTVIDEDVWGGSSAAVARGRLLVGLPPRTTQPLAEAGLFLVPPLRPALALLGETLWTDIREDLETELIRADAITTGGFRTAIGAGISIFDDTIALEWIQPLWEGGEGRLRFGLVQWF